MSESDKAAPYLSVDFGEQGGRHEWKNYAETTNWIAQLQSDWSWVSELGHQAPYNAGRSITNNLSKAATSLQRAQDHTNENHELAKQLNRPVFRGGCLV